MDRYEPGASGAESRAAMDVPSSDHVTQRELDSRMEAQEARLEAVESRLETKFVSFQSQVQEGFARLEGILTLQSHKIDSYQSDLNSAKFWIIGTIVTVGLALGAVVIGDRANILSAISTSVAIVDAARPAK